MSESNVTSLLAKARSWIKNDPDAPSRDELSALCERVEAGDDAAATDLRERFVGPLAFGTAGLRGVLGAGESRMNRAVVLRTTMGLGRYIQSQAKNLGDTSGVAIGYDGRRMSREFAEEAAMVLAQMGIRAYLSPVPCPTPVTAFAVEYLNAAAGIMVTASHNPPEYNGYKVYWNNGAQIIPPHDKGIAAEIDACPPAKQVAKLTREQAEQKGLVSFFSEALEKTYLKEVAKLRLTGDGPRDFPIVYTPLHGVGDRLTHLALEDAGFTKVTSVKEQAEPDGEFPTVRFPNPEEPGALDLALALADREKADLILANDPDVDRLAAAVRGPDGAFVQLSGNQVGVLLGHYLLTAPSADARHDKRLVLASCVSSPMLGKIAETLGVAYEETLTGFKWIANRAMELEKSDGRSFVFGYEEALGYTVGPLVRDKDGISAAVLLAELAAVLRQQGKTLLDRLDELAAQYGLYISRQVAITLAGSDGLRQIGDIMRRLREQSPKSVGETSVLAVRDVQAGTRTAADGAVTQLTLPKSNVLTFELEGEVRIIARPSGTEPKIKFYFDLAEPLAKGERTEAARKRAEARVDVLIAAFCKLAGVDAPAS